MTTRPNAVRPIVMDRPVLYSLVERLRAEERLTAVRRCAADARPRVGADAAARARRAALRRLDRGLIVVLPEDADARDAAEAAAWFVGDERVALFPSRGVHWAPASSRRRTSSANAPGRSRCSSREGSCARPRRRSPKDCRRVSGRAARGCAAETTMASTSLAEHLASAGYERVDGSRSAGIRSARRARRRLPDDRARAAPDRALR